MPTADVAVVFKQPRYIVDEGDDVDVCITRQGTLSDILSFTLVTCLGSRSTVVTACGDADGECACMHVRGVCGVCVWACGVWGVHVVCVCGHVVCVCGHVVCVCGHVVCVGGCMWCVCVGMWCRCVCAWQGIHVLI